MNRIFTRLAVLVATLLWVASSPFPASAHSADNTPSSNYVTTVVSLAEGEGEIATEVARSNWTFGLRTIEAGSRLELEWRSGPEIVVFDYEEPPFPYLKVGPDGVFENTQSQATYLNASRTGGGVEVPDGLTPDTKTTWKKISNGTVARWHDHRAHYMGERPPPEVRKAPGKKHLIQQNTLRIMQGDDVYQATVRVDWKPASPSVPWFVLAFITALGLAVLAWRAKSGPQRLAVKPIIVMATVALLIVDAIHLFGISFGVKDNFGASMARTLQIGFPSFAAWLAAILGLILYRRRIDGLYLITFAAGLITVVGGLADLSALNHSSVPFAFPTLIARIVIALTIGLGAGLVIAGVLLTRPLPSEERHGGAALLPNAASNL